MKLETRSIENFDRIHLKDIGSLILTQGEQPALTIEADEDLLSEIVTEVRQGTLVLGLDDDWMSTVGKLISSVFTNTDRKVNYYLTCVDLREIKLSGKCDLGCESLSVSELDLRVSGLSKLAINHLDCSKLEMHISGRGEFTAAGRADQQSIRITGSAEYQAPELASQSTQIVISGQGNATLRVAEDLDITISGLGQVNYYGRPKIRQVISGIGKAKRLNED